MILDEAIERYKDNAEYERTHGSLQGCMEFKQLAEWLKELKECKSKCKWIRYDHRTVCPQDHDIDNPYWRIPENRMDALKYCPYCGKEIEVTKWQRKRL